MTTMDTNTLFLQAKAYLETAKTGYNKEEHDLIVDHLAEQHPSWEGIDNSEGTQKIDCPLCILQAERQADEGDFENMYVQIRIAGMQAFWAFQLKKTKKFKKRLKLMDKALGKPHRLVEPKGVDKHFQKWLKKKGW